MHELCLVYLGSCLRILVLLEFIWSPNVQCSTILYSTVRSVVKVLGMVLLSYCFCLLFVAAHVSFRVGPLDELPL